jgi:amino-acid N-acetyltransferase
VVGRDYQGRGLGRALVLECLREARDLGITRVFALTLKPEFFEKLGFRRVPRSRFPQKIWRDCFKCRFFEACGEVAVEMDLSGTPGRDEAPEERGARVEVETGGAEAGAK